MGLSGLSIEFTGEASGFELFIALGVDLGLAASEAVVWSDVANGGVEAGGVVVVDEVAGNAFGILEAERGFGMDGLFFEGFVEALEFAGLVRT